MAFNIGYVGLCDRNIKHIYTTTDIKQPATRKPLPYKPDFLREQNRIRKDQVRNRRFMEYYPIHDIELPKAPSFRTLPKPMVDECVNRLMLPASERFNFKFVHNQQQNNWKQAYDEKIRRLRETISKFGGQPSYRQKPEAETGVDLKTDENGGKDKRKRRKGKVKIEEHNEDETHNNQKILKDRTEHAEKLPVLV